MFKVGINRPSEVATYNIATDSMVTGTAYEEFLRVKPDRAMLGEYYYTILNDAVRSYVMNLGRHRNEDILVAKCDEIVNVTNRYTRLIHASSDRNKALCMYRGVLKDVITNYTYMANDALVNMVYRGLQALLEI